LVDKPEGKSPLRRSRHRWNDDNEVSLREIWWQVVDRIHEAQDMVQGWTVVNTLMNLLVP